MRCDKRKLAGGDGAKLDALRRREVHAQLRTHRRPEQRAAGRAAPDRTADDTDAARPTVRAALEALPAEQRDVLVSMYFDGQSQSQIAERTGLPLGTVKSRTLLGMRRLRAALEGIER